MPPSFAPNPFTILQRRDDQASQSERRSPIGKLSNLLPTANTPPIRMVPSPLPVERSDEPATDELNKGAAVNPTELLVLAHGLQGMVDDFRYLLESLHDSPAAKDGSLLIHASKANQHKTHDGITLGGLRLAEDIRAIVKEHKSLTNISLMGFSLGGLYVRYAIAHLYNKNDGTICELNANKIVIVASPNLGVRSFGVYRFIPDHVSLLAKHLVLGDSTKEVFLLDDEKLLDKMSRDGEMPFLTALKSFDQRVIYANIRNDFMVNYGTAALDTSVKELNSDEVLKQYKRQAIDRDFDEKGCKVAFEFTIPKATNAASAISPEENGENVTELEECMANRLRSLGWRVIGVDFPASLPISHNRIVAMSRSPLHTWMNASGRRVVHHLVDTVSRDFEQHNNIFKAIQ